MRVRPTKAGHLLSCHLPVNRAYCVSSSKGTMTLNG